MPPARPEIQNQQSCQDPVLQYTPFDAGHYDMSPGLSFLQIEPTDPQLRLLQLDCEYALYRANKQACRQQNQARYVLEQNLPEATRQAVCQILIEQLCRSYPAFFQLEQPGRLLCRLSGVTLDFSQDYILAPHPLYDSLWDALADQIQEDLAVWQWHGDHDSLAALHVCAPNGWDPAEKIGKSFDRVHAPVPEMERQRSQYRPLLKGLIQKPAFCRFIWDLRSTDCLNLHPQAMALPDFDPEHPRLWVRLERQVLYGLPACEAVLFCIRTYRYPVSRLSAASLAGLDQALAGMSEAVLTYKHLDKSYPAIRAWLQKQRLAPSGSEPVQGEGPGTKNRDLA